jgi:hypothetical protein
VEYLHLWESLLTVDLQPEERGSHLWRFTENRQYSAKVAYEGFFWGSVRFESYERIWKS